MNRSFARWASRERISSAALIQAVTEMEAGLIDARLGAGLYKKRIGLPGRGKRGGARVLVAFRSHRRTVFLFGFAKSQRADISPVERRALERLAHELLTYSPARIGMALRHGAIIEVENDG
ncbi:type II toxin-antitoxin system RelE/ParE family toxin [Alloalcanivorax sp. C16-2]|uniref:type II toxin-antitoxin system RelE/ParE family toxin n=1 Tax=Alloalcanivorax sp. C16-2 TaxID=3390052 RepID=UPI0039707DBE